MNGFLTINEYSSEFESFWKHYPKKVGKKAAFKEWRKNHRPPLEELIRILMNQIKYKAEMKKMGKFEAPFPDPERWIKWARWEDEIPVTVGKPIQNAPIAMVKCSYCGVPYRVTEDHQCPIREPGEED